VSATSPKATTNRLPTIGLQLAIHMGIQLAIYVIQSELPFEPTDCLCPPGRTHSRSSAATGNREPLTSFLAQQGQAGPYGAKFFSLYMPLIRTDHLRYCLVSRGLLDCYQSLLTGSKWKLTDSLVKKQRAGRPNFGKAIQ